VLSGSVLAAGWIGTVAGVSLGLKKTSSDKVVRSALMSSAFFLASLVNIRVGPSSTHLSFIAPMGIILGYGAFPAVFIALLLQAILFHFGGLVVLGANCFAMALPALFVHAVFGRTIRAAKNKSSVMILSFVAGFIAVIMGASLAGAFLGLTDANFFGAVKLMFLAHVPLAFIEGAASAFLILWLKKVAPEFLSQ
ncbi:MAG: cobalt transporter CbiM, partial [Synergistaceae bacterium]|nr:cobalt transporter CbiM [Synergistaceae bacterium]